MNAANSVGGMALTQSATNRAVDFAPQPHPAFASVADLQPKKAQRAAHKFKGIDAGSPLIVAKAGGSLGRGETEALQVAQSRGLNLDRISANIRQRGYAVVAILDEKGSLHQTTLRQLFERALPTELQGRVRFLLPSMTHVVSAGRSGRQEVDSGMLDGLKGKVDRGEVDMVFTGFDLPNNPTLKQMSRWSNVDLKSFSEVNEAVVQRAMASPGFPDKRAILTLRQIAQTVPYFAAGGNPGQGTIQLNALAPGAIPVGAFSPGSTQPALSIGILAMNRDGGGASSYATPKAAADLLKAMWKKYGF